MASQIPPAIQDVDGGQFARIQKGFWIRNDPKFVDRVECTAACVKDLQKCLSRLMVPARDESRGITCPH